MASLSRWNKGCKFLLTGIDCFSKIAFVRAQRNKKTSTTIIALDHILNEINEPVTNICSDRGSEFYSKAMSQYLSKKRINLFSTNNVILKSTLVERFNRTLEDRLYRYLTTHKTKKYIDILQDIVDSYNATKHSSIDMAPKNVNSLNSELVWNTLYPPVHRFAKSKLRVGSSVRIQKKKKTFRKGYLSGWEPEIYIVTRVFNTTPYTYKLVNQNGSNIKRHYYARVLSAL